MKSNYFIAGTDTDVGKTFVSRALLLAAKNKGLKTVALKPIAAGCEQTEKGLRNSDALLLQEAMTVELPYQQVNPVALLPAIAPHIAAQLTGKKINVRQLAGYCRGALLEPHDFALVEGAGGWRVPLNSRESLADLAKELNFPVILVVRMGLGCLNHTLLTVEAIQRDGLKLAGWIANSPQNKMDFYDDNILSLQSRIPAPLIAKIPFLTRLSANSSLPAIDIDILLEDQGS
ncbi:dethiobiotin synthase [Aurantivibrio infirmus]